MTDARTDLVQKLAAIQRENGMTDAQLAERLGIRRPMWSYLKNGKLVPGRKTLEGVIRAFPELAPDVLAHLTTIEPEREKEAVA